MKREDPRARFTRLATARVNKALKAIALVGNLSERSNYSYSDSDVTRIFGVLEQELRDCRLRFASAGRRKPREFKL